MPKYQPRHAKPKKSLGDWWREQGYAKDHPLFSKEFEVVRPDPGPGPSEFEAESAQPQVGIPFTKVPTATSNRNRPRTIAAGYDKDSQTLRIQFRSPNRNSKQTSVWQDDGGGAVYDYHDVTPTEWASVRVKVKSTGRYVNRVLNSKDYTRIM